MSDRIKMTLREIDTAVAERVMGWTAEVVEDPQMLGAFVNYVDASGVGRVRPEDFCPSTDIATAWEVVEKLKERGHYCVTVSSYVGTEVVQIEGGDTTVAATAEAPTAPLAICLAALRAVGVDVEVSGE